MVKGHALERELRLQVILAKRVSSDEWVSRDKQAATIPEGSVVLEVDPRVLNRTDIDLAAVDPNELFERHLVQAYFVVGHAGTDRRPLCRPIGEEGGEWDLDLLLAPIILGSGAK